MELNTTHILILFSCFAGITGVIAFYRNTRKLQQDDFEKIIKQQQVDFEVISKRYSAIIEKQNDLIEKQVEAKEKTMNYFLDKVGAMMSLFKDGIDKVERDIKNLDATYSNEFRILKNEIYDIRNDINLLSKKVM